MLANGDDASGCIDGNLRTGCRTVYKDSHEKLGWLSAQFAYPTQIERVQVCIFHPYLPRGNQMSEQLSPFEVFLGNGLGDMPTRCGPYVHDEPSLEGVATVVSCGAAGQHLYSSVTVKQTGRTARNFFMSEVVAYAAGSSVTGLTSCSWKN